MQYRNWLSLQMIGDKRHKQRIFLFLLIVLMEKKPYEYQIDRET